MEKQRGSERNLERDKRLFIEALDSITIEEMVTDFDEEAVRTLLEKIQNTKVFLLGETHGVQENADIVYTIYKKFGFRQLALEWESYLKKVVEDYIETGEFDFETIKNEPDGRITPGHFVLIKKLHDEGLLDEIIYFKSRGSRSANSADKKMSKKILAGLTDVPTLVVAGSFHTQTKTTTLEDEPGVIRPMGERVKEEIPNVPSGKIEYLSGQYQNYGAQDFEESDNNKTGVPKFYISDDGIYTFTLPEATLAIVPDPTQEL